MDARVADCDKKEMANAILNIRTKPVLIANKCLKQDFGAKRLKHFVGPNSWTFFELLHGKEPAFLKKRV